MRLTSLKPYSHSYSRFRPKWKSFTNYIGSSYDVVKPKPIFNTSYDVFRPYKPKKLRYPLNSCDIAKIHRVKKWAYLANPVIGTCRYCGYRGFVKNPVVGLY